MRWSLYVTGRAHLFGNAVYPIDYGYLEGAVADDVASHAGFTLGPDASGRLVRHGRQLAVQLRHIHLDA